MITNRRPLIFQTFWEHFYQRRRLEWFELRSLGPKLHSRPPLKPKSFQNNSLTHDNLFVSLHSGSDTLPNHKTSERASSVILHSWLFSSTMVAIIKNWWKILIADGPGHYQQMEVFAWQWAEHILQQKNMERMMGLRPWRIENQISFNLPSSAQKHLLS